MHKKIQIVVGHLLFCLKIVAESMYCLVTVCHG